MNNIRKIFGLLCFYTITTFPTVPVKEFNIKSVILNNKITHKMFDLLSFYCWSPNNTLNCVNEINKKISEQNGIIKNRVSKEETLECLDTLDTTYYTAEQMITKILECHGVVLSDGVVLPDSDQDSTQ